MFTCNHCPFVKAYEDRLISIQEDYSNRSVSLVAINSNETINYPEDTFEKMQIRVNEKSYNFPYLRDEDQNVASSYGASFTPEIFVFDISRKLRYHGRIDDNKDQTVAKDDQTEKSTHIKFQENSARTGRPDLNEINKRNAEESLRDRKSSYTIAGIMALFVVVVIILVYLFS